MGSEEVWELKNGGVGWVHPMHLHQEEHHVIYRKFRSYRGKYVAHCHNLAHEDHAMMFGREIV